MAILTPIRGLRSFCVAAQCLSFKHAAMQLYLTPSAISHQIKQLEDQLGKQLFKRQVRSIELTADGRKLFESISPILEQLETSIRDFSQDQSSNNISITLPEFFASELMMPRLNKWSIRYPNINLQLETTKSKQESSKKTDLSIVLASSRPTDTIVHELFPIHYVPAVSPDLYEQIKEDGVEAINKVNLITHQFRPYAWHTWANEVEFNHFTPKQIVQVDSMFSVARAAQRGLGIALIPMPISKSWFDEKVLTQLFEQTLSTQDKYYLIQHDWHESRPELELFVEWLLAEFSTIQ